MSGFKGMMKDGWHPKGKDGGKESWRGDFKGINQVAGWMGKKIDPNKKDDEQHMSRPLSALKDPASFGPPPKNVNYHGGAALPNQITPHTGGWGAPLSQEQMSTASRTSNGPTQEEIEEEAQRAGPPLPYRADRTGLKTDHLPPPPLHRDVNRNPEALEVAPASQPRLPPRLPSRQSTATIPAPTPPPAVVSPPPPAYEAVPATQPIQPSSTTYGVNQAAVNRLGNAGVSVPALGIGSEHSSNPWRTEPSQLSQPRGPPPATQQPVNQISELQARFARMNSSASVNSEQGVTPPFVTPAQSPAPASIAAPVQPSYGQPAQPPPPAQGSNWAEKQSAMRTAQNAYKDPSSVSVQDAASAARTANTFRERHKDTIDAAGTRANSFNKKYNVSGRFNSFLDKHNSPTSASENPLNGANGNASVGQQQSQGNVQIPPQQQSPELTASISRKPPPPPPPKKPANMHGSVGAVGGAPPPVPLGTKPSYS